MSLQPNSILIRDVWAENLQQEFALISGIVDDYPYVAMDTEFPGTIYKLSEFVPDECYVQVRDNVNALKLIQVGFTFFDEQGKLPTCGADSYCIWQFNFREFDLSEHLSYAADSIFLLSRSGINFWTFNQIGVDIKKFGELLMSSGVVMNDNVRWITFHSKYDFGYLIKALTGRNLPETRGEFFQLMNIFFPVVYDIKYMIRFTPNLHGGLKRVAQMLGLQTQRQAHQAGGDSLLTFRTFKKLREACFPESLQRFVGVLCDLND